MWGAAFCIFIALLICEMRSGSSARLISTVTSTIVQPQFGVQCCCVQRTQANSGRPMKPKIPKSSEPVRLVPFTLCTASRMSTAFGPANSRTLLGPFRLPAATPSTSAFVLSPCGFVGSFGISMALRSSA